MSRPMDFITPSQETVNAVIDGALAHMREMRERGRDVRPDPLDAEAYGLLWLVSVLPIGTTTDQIVAALVARITSKEPARG